MWFLFYPNNTTNQIKNFIFSIELIISLFVGLLNVLMFVISVKASVNLSNGCCKCCSSPSQINRVMYFVAFMEAVHKVFQSNCILQLNSVHLVSKKYFLLFNLRLFIWDNNSKIDVHYKNYIQHFCSPVWGLF